MKTFTKFQKDVQKLAKRWSTTTDPPDEVLNQTWGMNKIDDFYKKMQAREGKKGEKKKKERVLCGGTNFDAPTDYVNKLKFDGHIVLTDMYAPKPKRSMCQRMWMTTDYHAKNPYFKTNERVIGITT